MLILQWMVTVLHALALEESTVLTAVALKTAKVISRISVWAVANPTGHTAPKMARSPTVR